MMLGGSNFLQDRLQAVPRGVDVLDRNATWPVRWRSDGCAVWFGRDGAVVSPSQFCKALSVPSWQWLYTVENAAGDPFDCASGEHPMSELLDPGRTWEQGYPSSIDIHDDTQGNPGVEPEIFVPLDMNVTSGTGTSGTSCIPAHWGQSWCGNNPNVECFMVPFGVRPPDPIDYGSPQICYRPGLRCIRLLLVRNAQWGANQTFDFSAAALSWLGDWHLRHGHPAMPCPPAGEGRPLDYAFPEWAVDLDETGDAPDCDFASLPGKRIAAAQTHGTSHWGVRMENAGMTHVNDDEFEVSSTRVSVLRTHRQGGGYDRTFSETRKYWTPTAAPSGASENVLAALTAQPGIARRLTGFESNPDPVALPFPQGTAFDMALGLRTWYWFRKKAAEIPGSGGHRFRWLHDGKGYLNTQVAGCFFQLAPAPPKPRRAAS